MWDYIAGRGMGFFHDYTPISHTLEIVHRHWGNILKFIFVCIFLG
jgi:hypothetical protein